MSTLVDWQARHAAAVAAPRSVNERPYVDGMAALLTFAGRYATDGVLDEGVALVALGLRTLLDGDTGRLDPGALDATLREVIERCGFDPDACTYDLPRLNQ